MSTRTDNQLRRGRRVLRSETSAKRPRNTADDIQSLIPDGKKLAVIVPCARKDQPDGWSQPKSDPSTFTYPSPALSLYWKKFESDIRKYYPGKTYREAAARHWAVNKTLDGYLHTIEQLEDQYNDFKARFDLGERRFFFLLNRAEILLEIEQRFFRDTVALSNRLYAECMRCDDRPPPAPTFHLFLKLPLEIRRIIWGFSMNPRVIEIRPKGEDQLDQRRLSYPIQPQHNETCRMHRYGYRAYEHNTFIPIDLRGPPDVYGWEVQRTAYPTVYHVCQESRAEVLRLYEPCDESTFFAARKALINYEIDTVYCPQVLGLCCDCGPGGCLYPDSNSLWRLATDEMAVRKIKSLAVTYGSFGNLLGFTRPETVRKRYDLVPFDIDNTMPKYKNLRELIYVEKDDKARSSPTPPMIHSWDAQHIVEIDSDTMPEKSLEYEELEKFLLGNDRTSKEWYGAWRKFDRLENRSKFDRETSWY